MTRLSPRAEAERAALAADVTVAGLRTPDDALAIERVFAATWGEGRGADASTLQAIAHAGNPVLVARRGEHVLGALFSFIGWDDGLHVHSHMTAVDPSLRSSGVGYALKLAQRAECLEHGIGEVRWTYDPLIRRNARFNLWKLGSTVRAFHPDFYGVLDDAINGTDRSDRFEVSWRLDSDEVRDAIGGRIARDDGGRADDVLVLPEDFEALRRERPEDARRLRDHSRAVFAEVQSAGAGVRFTGTGYVFDRTDGAENSAREGGGR